jgi:hypothetical protein
MEATEVKECAARIRFMTSQNRSIAYMNRRGAWVDPTLFCHRTRTEGGQLTAVCLVDLLADTQKRSVK